MTSRGRRFCIRCIFAPASRKGSRMLRPEESHLTRILKWRRKNGSRRLVGSCKRDYREAIEWIARDSLTVAAKWEAKILAAPEVLKRFPELGAIVEDGNCPGLRELLIRPYRITLHIQRRCLRDPACRSRLSRISETFSIPRTCRDSARSPSCRLYHCPRCFARRARAGRALGRRTLHLRPLHPPPR